MMRVPSFAYHAPRSLDEAAQLLREHGPAARVIAGGTDLVPNMKRRQQTPAVLISLRRVDELRRVERDADGTLSIGAGLTLTRVAALAELAAGQRALMLAASKVATPHIRNVGTLGGNLCLDTRCNYYNQNHEWRQAIGFCMKAPRGEAVEKVAEPSPVCWVATSSPRCWAVSSSDCAPALLALGAEVTLASADSKRRIPLAELYADDGMAYLTKRRDEIVAAIHLPPYPAGQRSTYHKVRRRGAFDFPVLGVGASLTLDDAGRVVKAALALGAVASRPLRVDTSELVGHELDDARIEAFARAAARPAKPLDNTDFHMSWRKKMCQITIATALRELGA
ncbi:MAG: FAD binding domain-containing protein [Myxococcales bacterium]|nr:FAD binding domain-containing protein [Myxococcales bacterium]